MATESLTATPKSAIAQSTPSLYSDPYLLDRIAQAELLKQGPALTPQPRALMTQLWRRTLSEIGEARFDAAFVKAMETSPYRPDISEIRRLAGIDNDAEARAALRWLIENMRYHGKKFGRAWCRKDGKRAMLAGSQRPKDADIDAGGIPSPDLPEATERALCEIGMGSLQSGLDFVWQHPGLDSVRDGDPEGTMRQREGEKIEKRWVEAWLRSEA